MLDFVRSTLDARCMLDFACVAAQGMAKGAAPDPQGAQAKRGPEARSNVAGGLNG